MKIDRRFGTEIPNAPNKPSTEQSDKEFLEKSFKKKPSHTRRPTYRRAVSSAQRLSEPLKPSDAPVSLSKPQSAIKANQTLILHWECWAEKGGRDDHGRQVAVRKLKNWIKSSDSENLLDLSGLGLTSLPSEWPINLRALDISNNHIRQINHFFPASIQFLDASSNDIKAVSFQAIRRTAPESDIAVVDNPMSREVLSDLVVMMERKDYKGSKGVNYDSSRFGPLETSVSHWVGHQKAASWHQFENEENSKAFSNFLDHLDNTMHRDSGGLRECVSHMFVQMQDNPQVRHANFAIAEDALGECEDRVAWSFTQMQKTHLIVEVSSGHYDNRLPQLVDIARGMSRLNKLDCASQKKIKQLQHNDPKKTIDKIGVFQAPPSALRDILNLPISIKGMKFFKTSGFTPSELKTIAETILASEEHELPDELTTNWEPWHPILHRLYPEEYDTIQTALLKKTDAINDLGTARWDAKCKAARRDPTIEVPKLQEIQREVWAEKRAEDFRPLTLKVLNRAAHSINQGAPTSHVFADQTSARTIPHVHHADQ